MRKKERKRERDRNKEGKKETDHILLPSLFRSLSLSIIFLIASTVHKAVYMIKRPNRMKMA
jgi:hypothetical protein